jgi:hypothetical protein
MVAAGTSAWLLVDGYDTEVEHNDEDEEAAAEAKRDTELCAEDTAERAAH